MKKLNSKSAILIVVLTLIVQLTTGFSFILPVKADSDTLLTQLNADNDQIAQLTKKIAEYQAQLSQLGSNKKTLQAAVRSLDLQRSKVQAQVALTQNQIDAAQLQIQDLSSQISTTQTSILKNKEQLAEYLREVQQKQDEPVIMQLLSAGSLSDFWASLQATIDSVDAVKQKNSQLHEEKQNLTSSQDAIQKQQEALSSQHDTLASQQKTLSVTESSKNELLSQTKSQESQYQKLLAQAKAELDSYSKFTQNSGGSGLLGHQTVCDSWGCYYNQRDSAWGGQALNGTQYTLASDGCLVTAMAMVMTHYGYKNVTPATINSNSSNFASYYAAYLLYTISAGGATATRKTAAIDATLAGGDPVVIGMKTAGGTHFVVLVSGSGGSYIMRDPYTSNGKDISFTSHYSVKSIYSISKVIVN